MKKLFVFIFLTFSFFSVTKANYLEDSINRFINSPSYFDLEFIEDPTIRFCEESYLDAYRKREFTDLENMICSDFFEMKIEDELNYIRHVLSER